MAIIARFNCLVKII